MKEIVVHAYTWYISDWAQSEKVAALSLEERGLYRELLDLCYAQGSLTPNDSTLHKLARCDSKEFRRAWPKVKECFDLGEDGRYHNERVDVELAYRIEEAARRSEAGKAGNDARWRESRQRRSAIANGSQTDRKPIAPHPLPQPHPQTPPQSRPVDDLRDEFWAAYPEKGGNRPTRAKPGLVTHWYADRVGHCLDPEKLHREIMAGLERAKASEAWAKDGGKFVCSATAFLEQDRWLEAWNPAPGFDNSENPYDPVEQPDMHEGWIELRKRRIANGGRL